MLYLKGMRIKMSQPKTQNRDVPTFWLPLYLKLTKKEKPLSSSLSNAEEACQP